MMRWRAMRAPEGRSGAVYPSGAVIARAAGPCFACGAVQGGPCGSRGSARFLHRDFHDSSVVPAALAPGCGNGQARAGRSAGPGHPDRCPPCGRTGFHGSPCLRVGQRPAAGDCIGQEGGSAPAVRRTASPGYLCPARGGRGVRAPMHRARGSAVVRVVEGQRSGTGTGTWWRWSVPVAGVGGGGSRLRKGRLPAAAEKRTPPFRR